jgi:hypothetical protein
MKKIFFASMLVAGAVAANAGTIASFADPTGHPASPMFTFNTNTNLLTGSYTGTGLTLKTPGFLGGGEVSDVKFEMSSVNLTPILPGSIYGAGAGVITFYTSSITNPLFTVNFGGGTLVNPFSFGASELIGQSVSFSGPNVPAGLSGEQFSFAFANAADVAPGVRTYTASFTSSAVPEPGTMAALGLGVAALLRRRKK